MPGFPSPERRARRTWLVSGAAVAMAAVAVSACLADTNAGTARAGTVRADAATSKVQTSITWGACPPLAKGATRNPAQKCGTVTVPLDYRHPADKTISIEVSELATAKPGAMAQGPSRRRPSSGGGLVVRVTAYSMGHSYETD